MEEEGSESISSASESLGGGSMKLSLLNRDMAAGESSRVGLSCKHWQAVSAVVMEVAGGFQAGSSAGLRWGCGGQSVGSGLCHHRL